jgi:hypothetical protein
MSVPRIGRVLDLVGAILFFGGAALYARSWLGLRDMEGFVRAEGDASFAAVERADALSRTGTYGVALMVAGVAVGILAAVIARRLRRREPAA